jgi:hypothetical protein
MVRILCFCPFMNVSDEITRSNSFNTWWKLYWREFWVAGLISWKLAAVLLWIAGNELLLVHCQQLNRRLIIFILVTSQHPLIAFHYPPIKEPLSKIFVLTVLLFRNDIYISKTKVQGHIFVAWSVKNFGTSIRLTNNWQKWSRAGMS